MDPVLAELYTNITSAPLLIAGYALIWVILLVFVISLFARIKKSQKDIDALQEAIERREKKDASAQK